MKKIFGILLIIAGVILGIYVGVWLCFIGGIVDIINGFKADDLEAINIAIGCAKVFFGSSIGYIIAIIPISFGITLLK
jgi:hypothetical protein